jgi:hypothetical protein
MHVPAIPQNNNSNWVWWFVPIIPATLEVEIGGSQSGARPGKSMKAFLKIN